MQGIGGLWCDATFEFDAGVDDTTGAPHTAGARPRVAVLREQGVNGHVEMAAAFDAAGFDAFDVHMSDLSSGRASLSGFIGLAACGGFSFGDVLGAGGGWAHSILFSPRVRDEFEAFFRRDDTFTLGVCNGCQMLERLRDLIPGAHAWPRFARNRSEQFEARLVMTRIAASPSLFLGGMEGGRISRPWLRMERAARSSAVMRSGARPVTDSSACATPRRTVVRPCAIPPIPTAPRTEWPASRRRTGG